MLLKRVVRNQGRYRLNPAIGKMGQVHMHQYGTLQKRDRKNQLTASSLIDNPTYSGQWTLADLDSLTDRHIRACLNGNGGVYSLAECRDFGGRYRYRRVPGSDHIDNPWSRKNWQHAKPMGTAEDVA